MSVCFLEILCCLKTVKHQTLWNYGMCTYCSLFAVVLTNKLKDFLTRLLVFITARAWAILYRRSPVWYLLDLWNLWC